MMSWPELWEALVFSLPAAGMAGAIAVAGGILGVPVILRRQTLAALALPQVVAVGVALALRLDQPAWALPAAALTTAVAIGLLARQRSAAGIDALVAACFVGGLCLSLLILANAGAHLVEMQNRFVGMDVGVDGSTVALYAPPLLVLGLLTLALWRRWLLVTQMPAVAELAGVRTVRWHYLSLAMLAAVVMLGTSAQGVVMVLSLLLMPAAIVLPWSRRVPAAMLAAAGVGILLVLAGDVLANEMNWPLSQSVGGAGVAALLLSRGAAVIVGR